MRHAYALPVALLVGVAVMAFAGCGGGSSNDPGPEPTRGHEDLVLLDRFGEPLTLASTEPYSPRQTCGECHDIDSIAKGYHFTQGRDNAAGTMQMKDDFFNDGRTFLKSDGMYGKW